MQEFGARKGLVTFRGNAMTLSGNDIQVGDTAPDVAATGATLEDIHPISSSEGKARLFVVIPSVDTPVCSLESKKFSDELKRFDADAPVAVYVVSTDLPFAQKRWCGAEGVDNLTMLSDHKGTAWGNAWGMVMQEVNLLARAIFVVGKDNKVTYREIVPEIGSEPDYAAAVTALKEAAK